MIPPKVVQRDKTQHSICLRYAVDLCCHGMIKKEEITRVANDLTHYVLTGEHDTLIQ